MAPGPASQASAVSESRPPNATLPAPVARLRDVTLRYGKTLALNAIDTDIPGSCMAGLIGPDGVGKSSLLALIAGARAIQNGKVEAFGGNMADPHYRRSVCARIAYMPQGLGRNLYPTLSVSENIDFFGRLFGQATNERALRIAELTEAMGLAPFADRAAGKLSGGMKQKLGLCCALIHNPDLLILDEPTTGVDPLSRRQFWDLIGHIRAARPNISVLVATAYMEEAAQFDWLMALDSGRVLASGKPREFLDRTGADTMEAAFLALLPEEKRRGHRPAPISRRGPIEADVAAIEASGLTMRFGDFTAVDNVNFRIARGEIFGFVGSNGCGKTTTMKMLVGLIPASEGRAWLFGHQVDPRDLATRRRVGYMSQGFSLYSELTVRQNLDLHARLFGVPSQEIPARVAEMIERFDLVGAADALPDRLPLGRRQRLSLAVAMIHRPDVLILDEPTSGVDPVARDMFWSNLIELSRRDQVTIFISTHFMNEAERCDRVALMHAGRVLVTDAPASIVAQRGVQTLEEAFIAYLKDSAVEAADEAGNALTPQTALAKAGESEADRRSRRIFDFGRMLSFARREGLELRRDPVRLTLALLGSAVLMLVMAYGVTLDVEELTFAALDFDQTGASRGYLLNLAGSRYFKEQAPIADYEELDKRMRAGKLSLAVEMPPGFARDLEHGRQVEIGAWIDGAMPTRAETVRAYVLGMHAQWLAHQAREAKAPRGEEPGLPNIETRFRYNPDVKSIVAMAPAMIPLLLLLIPAILTALSVVREKELGSIINFYVTPATRLEFLLGKQISYVALAMLNFLLLTLMTIILFGVPLKGSFLALSLGALLYVMSATAFGLLMSIFMRSQIAALFGTAILTILPATEFSGIIDPVSSLEGVGRLIGEIFPATHFLTISRGAFSKALGFADMHEPFLALLLTAPALLGLCAALLKKQEN